MTPWSAAKSSRNAESMDGWAVPWSAASLQEYQARSQSSSCMYWMASGQHSSKAGGEMGPMKLPLTCNPCIQSQLFVSSGLPSCSADLPAISGRQSALRTRSRFGWWLQLALFAASCFSSFQHCMREPCLSCAHSPLLWLPVPNLRDV